MTAPAQDVETTGRRALLVLTYYRPHVSGLTIYVERLANELSRRGHEVTVLTSRYDRTLRREEMIGGVRVVRVPVFGRVSKGVLMPILPWSLREARRHDVVSVHLPQFDGAAVALCGRLFGRPTVLTYHCDLRLPKGIVNRLADAVIFAMNFVAAAVSHHIVAYTQDYADHSTLLRRFPRKIRVIPPPVVMAEPDPVEVARFRDDPAHRHGPVIGIAARLATEKGVEFLVDAIALLVERHPDIRAVFAGQHENVVGEGHYREMLEPRIRALGDRWTFVGVLQPHEMSSFFGAVDVLVVSSVNSTESFGLVQVEAMLCGTPVVATDLPGVRQPVRMTGMGVVVPPRDARALAEGISEVVRNQPSYVRPREEIAARFDIAATVDAYEKLFDDRPRNVGDGPVEPLAEPAPDHLSRHLATMAPHRALLRSVECRLMGAVPRCGPVLDVGCGDGHFASIAYDTPIDVGVDVRRHELGEAAGRGPGVYRTVVAATGTALPFADGAFATVLSNCVIEHISDNEHLLAEASRVLRSGGVFATTLPSEYFADMLLGSTLLRRMHLRRAGEAYGRFFNRISAHHHVYPPAEWRRRFEAVGLQVIDQQYYFSAGAHRVFDASHYLGVPNLVIRKLTGRWVLHPAQMKPFERLLRPYYEEPLPQPIGAYQFVRCVKA